MISDAQLLQQLPFVLADTHFEKLGKKYSGKVRDNYIAGDTRYLVTTDRLSCFDVVVTTIPFKGQVLNQMAVEWFKLTSDIVPNHILDVPDPSVMVVRNCETLPVEVVVRSYLTGSAFRDYQAGKAISGVTLPPGMKASQKLPQVIITPSTKAEKGKHDLPISEAEILSQRLVDPALWEQVKEVAFGLFRRGQEQAAKHGLILVDTKYEFGMSQNELMLVDEIHTLDSSRYWRAATYKERFEKGESPEMLDKEPTRQWLLSQGYKGEGEIPKFTDEHRVKIARHYIDSYNTILGTDFHASTGSVTERIRARLKI
jgi:phosphoribosylaminoimidazole-succinocarboxamide synthase